MIMEMMRLRRISTDEEASISDLDSVFAEGGDEAALEKQMAEEEDFANQKADWDKAEQHRLANLAYKVLDIDLMSGDNVKCLCCNQPIPDDQHYFSPCDDNMEFAKLGAAGFPLLFEFNKQICMLFFVMAILYWGPLTLSISGGLSEATQFSDIIPDISDVGLNSIGVFFYDPTTDAGIRYFEDSTGPDLASLQTVGLYLLLCLVILYATLMYIRRNLDRMATDIDATTYTQSDFAIIGRLMEFDDYSEEGMREMIMHHMKEKYDIDEIEYFTPSFDIRDFYEVNTVYQQWASKKHLIEDFCRK